MSTFENIFLHTGGLTPEQAAEQLAAALGARLTRKNNNVYLARPMTDAPGGTVGGEVYANIYDADGQDPLQASLIDDYDTVFAVWCSTRAEELQAMEASKIFDEITAKLGWAAVMLHDQDLLITAWSPALGRRDFPSGATPDPEDRDHWEPYAHPAT